VGSARHNIATQHKYRLNTQILTPRVRFETTSQVLERAKTVHALDHVAIVVSGYLMYVYQLNLIYYHNYRAKTFLVERKFPALSTND
jgi:hypothetical protein